MNHFPNHTVWSNEQILEWQAEILEALTPEKLAAWLKERSNEVVGHARNQCRCPVRNYLQDVTPHLDAEVGVYQVTTMMPQYLFNHGRFKGLIIPDIYYLGQPSINNKEVPGWLSDFLQEIDKRFCYQTELGKKISRGQIQALYTECDFPVTGQEALTVLQEMCPWLTLNKVV